MPKVRPATAAAPAALFVDSSAWIALVSASDGRHHDAHLAFERAVAARRPLVTTTLVVAEVHGLLLHRAGIVPARIFLGRLERSALLSLSHPGPAEHVGALRWIDRLKDQRISYVDAVSFAVMAARHIREALTFDRHFTTAGWQSFP